MHIFMHLCRAIDTFNDVLSQIGKWACLAACVISAGNAVSRYIFNMSSNAWLEIQWYLFACAVMLSAAKVYRLNEHVRVDVIYGKLSSRGKVYVDLLGISLFLLPVTGWLAWLAMPFLIDMMRTGEISANAGGLARWPAMLMLPLGFASMFAQGISEALKRIAWLNGTYELPQQYERPLQ